MLIVLGVFLVIAGSIFFWGVGVSNSEITIAERGNAQQKVCQAFFSNMWEILKSKGAVTTEYAEQNNKFVTALMEGRYSKGDGSLMKWITEQNPQFDPSLYKDLMASIEGLRNSFFIEQSKLIDIDRQHRTMRKMFFQSLIIGRRPDIGGEKGIVILKNLATKDAYETGTDSTPELFGKK